MRTIEIKEHENFGAMGIYQTDAPDSKIRLACELYKIGFRIGFMDLERDFTFKELTSTDENKNYKEERTHYDIEQEFIIF